MLPLAGRRRRLVFRIDFHVEPIAAAENSPKEVPQFEKENLAPIRIRQSTVWAMHRIDYVIGSLANLIYSGRFWVTLLLSPCGSRVSARPGSDESLLVRWVNETVSMNEGAGQKRQSVEGWEAPAPGPDLNPHSACAKKDFKSFASADFATRAC